MTGHMFGEHSTELVANADAVLIVGTYVFPEVFPNLASPFRAGARIVHIDLNTYEIAKNHPVDLGIVADPRAALAALAGGLVQQLDPKQRRAAASRLAERTEQRNAEAAAVPVLTPETWSCSCTGWPPAQVATWWSSTRR